MSDLSNYAIVSVKIDDQIDNGTHQVAYIILMSLSYKFDRFYLYRQTLWCCKSETTPGLVDV